MQVAEATHKYARGTGLSVVPLYGGASMPQQIRALERGADIVVATPGRALDHIRRRSLTLDAIELLVLDEADEMLDMGFAEDIDAILDVDARDAARPRSSRRRCRRGCGAIAERHLRDPERITIAREKTGGRQAAARAPGGVRRRPARTRRRRCSACSTWRARRRRSCSAARGSKSTRWSRR